MHDNELFHLARSIEDDCEELDSAGLLEKPRMATRILANAVRLMNELVKREISRNHGTETEKS